MDDFTAVIWGLIGLWLLAWGAFTGWLADQKGRDSLAWFALGVLFGPLALLSVGMAPTFASTLDERFRDEEDE